MATNVGMDEKGKKDLEGEESVRRERETEEGLILSRLYLDTACSSLLPSILNAAHRNYVCSPLLCLRGYD